MTLRLSLVIDGDASGGKKAAAEATQAYVDLAQRGVAPVRAESERMASAMQANLANVRSEVDTTVVSLAKVREQIRASAATSSASPSIQRAFGGAGAVNAQTINAALGLGASGADRGADIEAYGKQLDALRAKFNPVFAAGQQYKTMVAEINDAARVGAITEKERTDALQRNFSAFTQQVSVLNRTSAATTSATAAGRLQRYEMINLSRQIQDVGVSLASGQKPFLVAVQQGTQIADIFASSEGSVKSFFQQAISGVTKFLSPARLAGGAILGIGITAAVAASQWGEGQRQIELGLTGIGRASGMAAADINRIGVDASSTFGLSQAEARNFALELASTGKIGKDNIEPIVKLGYDAAIAFGTDAAGAQKLFAKAFADPVKGAVELNNRLGFLDAAMLRQITNLQQQNKLYEAQALLTAGVKSGLQGINDNVATSTKFWTAIGNAISGAWDAFGRGASRLTGIGFSEGLDEQIARVRDNIAGLQKQIESLSSGPAILKRPGTLDGLKKQLAEAQAEYDKLQQKSDRYWQSVAEAQARQRSFAIADAIGNQLPEIDQLAKLRNQQKLLVETMIDVQVSGGAASPILQRLGLSYEQLAKALAEATGKLDGFQAASQRAMAGVQLQIDFVGKRSPAALGELAFKQSLANSGSLSPDAVAKATLDRTLAVKQAQQQIADTQNQQLLTAKQRVDTAGLELSILGRGSVEQERQRALLQARQQLEQDALRLYGDRDAYDQKHLAALEKQINAEAAIKQVLAEQQALRDVAFDRSQIGRTSDEQQIASRLRSIYGDNYQAELNGAIAQQMRLNQQLQQAHDIGQTAFKGVVGDLARGATLADALRNASTRMFETMLDKAGDLVFSSAWNGLLQGLGGGSSSGGLLASLFSGLGGFKGFDSGGYTGNVATHQVAGVVHGQEWVVDAPKTRKYLPLLRAIQADRIPGYAGGGFVGAGPPLLPLAPAAPAWAPSMPWPQAGGYQITNFYVETPSPRAFAEDRVSVMRGINRTIARAKRYA